MTQSRYTPIALRNDLDLQKNTFPIDNAEKVLKVEVNGNNLIVSFPVDYKGRLNAIWGRVSGFVEKCGNLRGLDVFDSVNVSPLGTKKDGPAKIEKKDSLIIITISLDKCSLYQKTSSLFDLSSSSTSSTSPTRIVLPSIIEEKKTAGINQLHPIKRQVRYLSAIKDNEQLTSDGVIAYLFLSLLSRAQTQRSEVKYYGEISKEVDAVEAGVVPGAFMTFKFNSSDVEYCAPNADYKIETQRHTFTANLQTWLNRFIFSCVSEGPRPTITPLPEKLCFLVPINCNNSHWIAASIMLQQPNQALLREVHTRRMSGIHWPSNQIYQKIEVCFMDSLGSGLSRIPADEHHKMELAGITKRPELSVPRQSGVVECGAMAVRNLLNIVDSYTPTESGSLMAQSAFREIKELITMMDKLTAFRETLISRWRQAPATTPSPTTLFAPTPPSPGSLSELDALLQAQALLAPLSRNSSPTQVTKIREELLALLKLTVKVSPLLSSS